jgi:putative FmdB family regulatory protein
MPVFEYKCKTCGNKFDIFHFTKEVTEDIICPKCQSKEYEKQLSSFSANMNGSSNHHHDAPSPCANCCNGPSCGMNF